MTTDMLLYEKIEAIDWPAAFVSLNRSGNALIPEILDLTTCQELIALYERGKLFRKTVVMEKHRFGRGEYKYFHYPLPEVVQFIRERVYSALVPLANEWMRNLNQESSFPAEHSALLARCREKGQDKATVLMLKYDEKGFNTLHQDLYGGV
jgi:uncharacterized protein